MSRLLRTALSRLVESANPSSFEPRFDDREVSQ